ncbi:MAG: hypothetical protein K0R39_1954 [Symbiobacteriaceae bacterium]|jgi:hypothetical protein|nr:hypothetical protein [Symbiobacteriaceae bacterium]
MRRKWTLAVVIVLAALVFGACAGGGSAKQESAAPSESRGSTGSAPPNQGAVADGAAPAASPQPGVPAGEPTPVPLDRKIIKNASFDIRVKDGDAAVNKITASVTGAGGYVQDVKQSGTAVQGRTINMTVRVPAVQYAALTTIVRELGEVNNQHEWTEDVTEAFVDLEERIKTKEIHLTQLNKLYAQGGTIQEMLQLESEIARVTADLESMKGRMRVLSNRVDFSTMVINLYEPGVPTPISPPKTVWERMQRGFTGSWNGVVNFLGNFVVFAVSAIPVLVLLAVFGGIAFLIVRFSMKRMPKQTPPAPGHYTPPFAPPLGPQGPPQQPQQGPQAPPQGDPHDQSKQPK